MSSGDSRYAWRFLEEDRATTGLLSNCLGIPRLVAHVLASRGVRNVEAGRTFLHPSATDITDPFELTDMDRAVERIREARDRGEAVLVFGDYDVDGIAGTAVLIHALRRFGISRCSYGMPSRLIEGYGLAAEHVAAAHADGISLIVTVDNGVNAREAGAAARRLGVDLVVTDHHTLEGELPDAVAVVDPKREPGSYAGRYASGAAVAFHLARALTGAIEDLDVVALGIVADIVPLCGENRVLVALGLEHMVRHASVGLRQLASVAGIAMPEITAEKIAFQLAPRINAAGRLGDGLAPLRLLLTDSMDEARALAADLNRANDERRAIEKQVFQEAIDEIERDGIGARSSIVLARRGWHAGVIGVVASRLQSQYHRPIVLIAVDEDGVGRGSARSPESFGMVEALSACRDLMERFGGHAAAAGLTIRDANLDAFQRRFEEEAGKRMAAGVPVSELEIDALVSFGEIDAQLVKNLNRLEPFGCMNPHPVLCTSGVAPVPDSFRDLRGGHGRLTIQHGPRTFEAVGFNMAGILSNCMSAPALDIAFTPQLNTWRGETRVQLVLKDVRPCCL